MKKCEGLGRLIAVDLIGMGDSEKLNNVDDGDIYKMKEQVKYFSAFLDAVGVNRFTNVTFVAHSWGGTLAAYWASKHPEAVKGFASIEVVYQTFSSWSRVHKKIRGGVKLMLRKPFTFCCFYFDFGANLILKKNIMLESIPDRVNRKDIVKSGTEMEYYRRGYEDVESRCPMLAFVRSIPVAGSPKGVVEIMEAGRNWIESSEIPTTFISVEPGTMTENDRNVIRSWKNVTEVKVERGHMVTEDSLNEVGEAIVAWFREKLKTWSEEFLDLRIAIIIIKDPTMFISKTHSINSCPSPK